MTSDHKFSHHPSKSYKNSEIPFQDLRLEEPEAEDVDFYQEFDEDEGEDFLGDEGGEEEAWAKGIKAKTQDVGVVGMAKPQVWVRVRPTPEVDQSVFEIDQDNKMVRLLVEPKERLFQKKPEKTAFSFVTDGILQHSSQEEVYQQTIQETVDKAMDGVPSAVICLGPDLSGKSFTLFGPHTTYSLRGILPRALENIFQTVEGQKDEMEYHIILSMFEIRRDKIKDLLTLGPYELKAVGDFGPKGLFYEEITSVEQGLGLILRGTTGQKQIRREPYAKYHTVVYVDILAKTKKDEIGKCQKEWRSRITFAKIASIPKREPQKKCPPAKNQIISDCFSFLPATPKSTQQTQPQPTQTCCEGSEDEDTDRTKCCRGLHGKLAETISIRKDLSFLEQMFIRAQELRKIHDYYNKLQNMGMYMLMRPPKPAPSQYFRQSKLAHCLKDIVSGQTLVKIILHVRPERCYIQSTLESMRFATRARCIPTDLPKKEVKDDRSFEKKICDMCEEMGIPNPGGDGENVRISPTELAQKIGPNKMVQVLQQATQYFEEKLDNLEGSCKDQVKTLFETFREMLTHVLDKDKEPHGHRYSAKETEYPGESAFDKDPDIPQTEDPSVSDSDPNLRRKSRKSESVSQINKKGRSKDKDKDAKAKPSERLDSKKKKRKASPSSSNKKNQTPQRSMSQSQTQTLKQDLDPQSDADEAAAEKDSQGGKKDSTSAEQEAAKASPRERVNRGSDAGPPTEAELGEKGMENSDAGGKASPPGPQVLSPDGTANGSASPLIQMHTDDSDKWKEEFWLAFTHSHSGTAFVGGFVAKQSVLRVDILEHNEIQNELTFCLAQLSRIQLNLDVLEQYRKLRGRAWDEQGNVVVSPGELQFLQEEKKFLTEIQVLVKAQEQLVPKLMQLRSDIQAQKHVLEVCKKECEQAFVDFCKESFGVIPEDCEVPLNTLGKAYSFMAEGTLGFPKPEEEAEGSKGVPKNESDSMEEHFERLKRIAEQQANTLLKAYPTRPPWNMYY